MVRKDRARSPVIVQPVARLELHPKVIPVAAALPAHRESGEDEATTPHGRVCRGLLWVPESVWAAESFDCSGRVTIDG
jgi:hypothetical protein